MKIWKHGLGLFLIGLSIGATGPSWADGAEAPAGNAPSSQEQLLSEPRIGKPVIGGFVVDGGLPGDWSFRMGPIGSPQMNLKLIRANSDKSGAIGFYCERASGAMQIALVLPHADFTPGSPTDLIVTVGTRTAKLRTRVDSTPIAGAPPIFEATGPAVVDILTAMGGVDEELLTATIVFRDAAGHSVAFGLTKPRLVATTAAKVCHGWNYDAEHATLKTGVVTPVPPILHGQVAEPEMPPSGGVHQP